MLLSLKALAAKKLYEDIWDYSNEEIATVYHSIYLMCFGEDGDNDALGYCLKSLEEIITDSIYAEKLAKDPISLPFFLSLLMRKEDEHILESVLYILDILCYEKQFGTKIRATLIDNLHILAYSLEEGEDGFPSPHNTSAFLTLLLTLMEEPNCAKKLENLHLYSEEDPFLIPYLTGLLKDAIQEIQLESEKYDCVFAKITTKIISFLKICSRYDNLIHQIDLDPVALPLLSCIALNFYCVDDRKYAKKLRRNSTEVATKLIFLRRTLGTYQDQDYVREFADLYL